jgi:hypothetical protein
MWSRQNSKTGKWKMESILAAILAALVAGATAKAKDVATTAVSDAYDGLKSLLIRKLGKGGAVQSVEDDPESEPASATLAEAIAKQGLAKDAELATLAERMMGALAEAKASAGLGTADIEIETVHGRVNAIAERLAAVGRIKLGPVIADQGDATVRDLLREQCAGRREDGDDEPLNHPPT